MFFIVFIFDKQIHNYFRILEFRKFKENTNDREIARLQAEWLEIYHVDTDTARRRCAEIERRLRDLHSNTP